MKFAQTFSLFLLAFAPFATGTAEAVPLADQELLGRFNDARNLEDDDVQSIVIGTADSLTITIDQTAANGLLTFGEQFFVLAPFVSGDDSVVTCTATLDASAVNMQFYLRKALNPDEDENGEAQDFDCGANSDNDLVAPDEESCSVTNFPTLGDAVFGYMTITDDAFGQGTTYTVDMVCNLVVPEGSFCFSEDSTVDILGQGTTSMKDLAVGDKILVDADQYEPVYAFAHLEKNTAADFLQIHTDLKNTLEVTKDHLLLVGDNFVPASEVKVGDILTSSANGPVGVTKITTTQKTGLYTPLTPSGSLMVNGIKASAYVSLQHSASNGSGNVMLAGGIDTGISYHFTNHMALSPIRLACTGISSSFCGSATEGYAPFVTFWLELVKFFESHHSSFMQVALFLAFLLVVAPLYIVECAVGAGWAPTIVFGIVGVVSVAMKPYADNNSVEKVKSV